MQRGFIAIPVAIVIAGVIIAAAVIFAVGKGTIGGAGTANVQNIDSRLRLPRLVPVKAGGNDKGTSEVQAVPMRPVTADDHIRGSANAAVKIIEYSDTECPFCKQFHPVLKQIIADYGGNVAWVYRHFPIAGLHPKAAKEAEATECAAELGGNEKFWAYLDRLFEVTPANNGLNPAELPRIAEYVGLNRGQFESCLASGRHASRVQKDLNEAIAVGADGTPYSIFMTADGKRYPVSGSLPYEAVKTIVDGVLAAE